MKNIFTVSEQEKNRILGLHEAYKPNKENLIVEQDETSGDKINISGQIADKNTSEGNVFLIGVNVIVKDSNPVIGTSTDTEGKFILKNIPSDSTILFSYIGYEKLELPATSPFLYSENGLFGHKHIIELGEDSNIVDVVTITAKRPEDAPDPEISGCMDPGASNYNPKAGSDCAGTKLNAGVLTDNECCTYGEENEDPFGDLDIIVSSEEEEAGEGWLKSIFSGWKEKRAARRLANIQDPEKIKIIVDKIGRAQDGKVSNKSKVNLFTSNRAANRSSAKGYIGQVRINGYAGIIMNDEGTKMVGMTWPVLKKNTQNGKYDIEDRLTYKFYRNKLRLGQERVHVTKQFREFLKIMEKYHKDLNKQFSKIPQGDFGGE